MRRPGPPCFCSPGAYLVVKGVVTGYVREYRTIAAWAVQTERGIVRADSHTPPDTLLLPLVLYLNVWLLFITQDNINSILNKRGNEASFEAVLNPVSSTHLPASCLYIFLTVSPSVSLNSPSSSIQINSCFPQTTDLTGWHYGSTVTDHFNWFWKAFLSCLGTPDSWTLYLFPSGSHHWIWTVKLWSLEIQYFEATQLETESLSCRFYTQKLRCQMMQDGDRKPATKPSVWSRQDYITLPGNVWTSSWCSGNQEAPV